MADNEPESNNSRRAQSIIDSGERWGGWGFAAGLFGGAAYSIWAGEAGLAIGAVLQGALYGGLTLGLVGLLVGAAIGGYLAWRG